MQVICNYTNNDRSGFTHMAIYKATKTNGCVYVHNDTQKRICIGGVSLTHTIGISDSVYALARFKEVSA